MNFRKTCDIYFQKVLDHDFWKFMEHDFQKFNELCFDFFLNNRFCVILLIFRICETPPELKKHLFFFIQSI